MKKTSRLPLVIVAGIFLVSLSASAGMNQGDTQAEEMAIKHMDQQDQAVSKVLEPRGSVAYAGDTTGGPTWARAYTVGDGTSGSCSVSGSGTTVPYNSQDFHVDTTGLYTMTAVWTGFDGYLHLYEIAFNPADQCVNLIALDDDFGGTSGSQILDFTLTAGVQYIVIAGGYGNTDFGPFGITIDGVGTPILGTVPVELMSFSIE